MFFAMFVSTLPYRHGRCPKTVAAQVPVRCGLHCFGKTSVLQVAREPVDIPVLLQHLLALAFDIHKPARVSPVHQFCAATVAVWVAVRDVFNLPDHATFMQLFGDRLVSLPYVFALPLTFTIETVIINNAHEWETLLLG